jgi:hypothetical protein
MVTAIRALIRIVAGDGKHLYTSRPLMVARASRFSRALRLAV